MYQPCEPVWHVSSLNSLTLRLFIICTFNVEGVFNTCCRWMENTIPTKYAEMVHFVDSLWYPFVQEGRDEGALATLLGSVDVSSQIFVFFPMVIR